MATPSAAVPQASSIPKRRFGGDEVAYGITLLFSLSILAITVLLVYELWQHSALTRDKFGLGFIGSKLWNPVTSQFGALPFIYGTVITSILALLISVPLGVGAAIYLSELATSKVSNTLTFLVELLAAVPSVIFGLLAIFTVIPLMRDYIEPAIQSIAGFLPLFSGRIGAGAGYLTAGAILAIMTFPYIISVSREALMAVPREQREAALALGATKWESTWDAVLPFARLGIMGSVFLALARALGETMAVTMVIGNDRVIHTSLFAPGYTIAAVIANEFAEAEGNMHLSALIELGLVLFALTMVINGLAQLLIIVTTKKGSAKG
ncbi:MAG TPA: phosphate ABC transporter permease subunit PstC [Bryobacteraceae bacterium]|jgi:phosphate transport system permease protein|nr:phosphate ABC transporter permease subunit PstC [Bryobacteraceae bacterium]